MAEDFIEEIYDDAELIVFLKKIMQYCRRLQWKLYIDTWEGLVERLSAFCRKISRVDEDLGSVIWNSLVEVKYKADNRDLIGASDVIEELIPNMYAAVGLYGKIDVSEGNLRFYSTRSGFLCIQNILSGENLVSSIDPVWEAYEKAEKMFNPAIRNFCTVGIGLGYLAWQMFELSNQSIDIYVYDIDMNRVNYAYQFGVLDRIPKENVHLFINNDIKLLFETIENKHIVGEEERHSIISIEPYIYNKTAGNSRIKASAIQSKLMTSRNFMSIVEQNFYRNYRIVRCFIDDLDLTARNDWIVVGGGPSLDYNIQYLKENRHRMTIICATTVVGRLLSEGIEPDYMVAIDMQNRTYGHLDGLNDLRIPLLMTDCANWQFGEKYKGSKYLIPTGGMFFSEEIYKRRGIKTWKTAGTVVTMCIAVAIYSNAKRIELIGIDLAYPGGETHSAGTMDHREFNTKALIKVKSVEGNDVYTDNKMLDYKSEIEDLIMSNPKIDFINRSKYGAYIKNCIKA